MEKEVNNLNVDFINLLKKEYEECEIEKILNGFSQTRATTFRINRLKTTKEKIDDILKKSNLEFENVDFCEDAYILKNGNESDLENLDIFKNGEIYLQNLSSLIPCLALDVINGNDILDMCASPGGKTCFISSLYPNTNIMACETNEIRFQKLKFNLNKQNVKNVNVNKINSLNLDDFYKFDSILLDSPCSGTGTFLLSNENSYKYFSLKLLNNLVKTQEKLLNKAINLLKKGQTLIYSTCSILKEENEEILKSVLKTNKVEIVNIEDEKFKNVPRLKTDILGTMCVCPTNMFEGFFVAKLKKK